MIIVDNFHTNSFMTSITYKLLMNPIASLTIIAKIVIDVLLVMTMGLFETNM